MQIKSSSRRNGLVYQATLQSFHLNVDALASAAVPTSEICNQLQLLSKNLQASIDFEQYDPSLQIKAKLKSNYKPSVIIDVSARSLDCFHVSSDHSLLTCYRDGTIFYINELSQDSSFKLFDQITCQNKISSIRKLHNGTVIATIEKGEGTYLGSINFLNSMQSLSSSHLSNQAVSLNSFIALTTEHKVSKFETDGEKISRIDKLFGVNSLESIGIQVMNQRSIVVSTLDRRIVFIELDQWNQWGPKRTANTGLRSAENFIVFPDESIVFYGRDHCLRKISSNNKLLEKPNFQVYAGGINCMCGLASGEIVLGTEGCGVVILNKNLVEIERINNMGCSNALSIQVLPDGRIVAGYDNGDLIVYDGK